MANNVTPDYLGNQVFRNQPNHSYFDKPFDDDDCLFQALHEIDPHFLKSEQKAELINYTSNIVTDPRTKKAITKTIYDHTKEEETIIFPSPKKSIMRPKEHELGVRILSLMQQCLELEEDDTYNWYRLQKIRLKEKEVFQKFVLEYNQSNKEILYAPCRRLLEMYQKWYNSKSARLIKQYPQQSYNTHLGLPHFRLCKNPLSDQQAQITKAEIVTKVGDQCMWEENIKEDFKKLNYLLESYGEIFENSEDVKESLELNLKNKFEKIIGNESPLTPSLYMPLESLLFIATAGDYVDLPREMLLNIKEKDAIESGPRKYIVMDLPLPSRQGGWHTYEQVVDQAMIAMLSLKEINYLEKDIPNPSADTKQPNFFKASIWQDFMSNSKFTADKLCKFSKTLIKWQLAATEDEINFKIFSSIELLEENKNVALKLEYKPKFGCEIYTKYKLLKEWFKLKLLEGSETCCLRLDATSFRTLLEEPLNIPKLEECLSSVYHLRCNELLNNLFEFLKMLYGMPLGHYMLRFNPKFKDKLLLCKPSQEITQNTVHLHQLLNDDVTDIEFISQENYLPIDANVCSLMHLQHKILPAAFSPFVEAKKLNKTITFCSSQNNKVIEARLKSKKLIQTKKLIEKKNKDTKEVVNKSKKKRANRRRREYEANKKKTNELKEMEQEMELDRLMLTNT